MKRVAPLREWNKWWVRMWVGIVAMLLVAVPFVSFWHWWTAAAVGFGVPETIGAWKQDDAFPPLTHVIVKYVHPELAMPALHGLAAGIGAFWFGFPHPGRLALLFGFMGWFDPHFLLRYIERRFARRKD